MKRILFIHHGGIAGGAPFSMLYTMQGIRDKGYHPIVGLMHPMQALHDLYNGHGFETYDMPWLPMFITMSGGEGKRYNPIVWNSIFRTWRKWDKAKEKLFHFIKSNNVSLVHLNSVGISCAASMLIEEKIPFIWHVREHGPVHKGKRYKFIQDRLKKSPYLIFLSKAEQKSWIGDNQHGTIVHNFIDFNKFDYELNTQIDKSKYGIKPNHKVLLYVGGSKLHKGIIPFLHALSIVKKKYQGQFICLMPDTFIDESKALSRTQKKIINIIKQEKLESVCNLMPFTSNIVDLFAACDVLTFPATKPHFARPIIEASAMKKPVIASNLKAIDELVLDQKTGYLIPPDNPQILAEKIIYLFDHPEVCKQFGENGHRFAQENFEFNKQIDKINQLYEKQLK